MQEIGVEGEIIKVTDLNEIVDHGIMMTPGLIVNEKIKSSGKVPKVDEVKKFIEEEK